MLRKVSPTSNQILNIPFPVFPANQIMTTTTWGLKSSLVFQNIVVLYYLSVFFGFVCLFVCLFFVS